MLKWWRKLFNKDAEALVDEKKEEELKRAFVLSKEKKKIDPEPFIDHDLIKEITSMDRFLDGPWPIIVVGDSHAERSFKDRLSFRPESIGPRTAFRIRNHQDLVMSALNKNPGKRFLFLLGEIDVRMHIFKQHKTTGRSTEAVVEEVAEKYVGFIAELKDRGYNVAILNVSPPGNYRNNGGMRFLPNPAERKLITHQLNVALQKHSNLHGVPFINVYNHTIDARGMRKKDLVLDQVHLNNKYAGIVKGYIIKKEAEKNG